MLGSVLLSTVLLAQAFTAHAQHAQHQFVCKPDVSCAVQAVERGLPADGWKVVEEHGHKVCRRDIIQEFPDEEHKHHGPCPEEICNPCKTHPVCGKGKYLGIKYGHCYILSFSNGQQLSTVRENVLYSKGGFFNDIPFKVCKATDDCSRGAVVEQGQTFYLQDTQGRYNDPKGTPGWIDNANGGGHIGFTYDAKSAGSFKGIPSCGGGECAIKVLGGPNFTPNGPTCPATTPGISFFANPKLHDPIRFTEVTCDDYEVPPTSLISPNVNLY